MWRATFLGLGAYACLLGAECLVIDKAVLNRTETTQAGPFAYNSVRNREFVPPDWAPWSLLSGGAVTMLYSFTLPKRGEK